MALTVDLNTREFVFSRICDNTDGANRMRLYGTVNGTADQQIDTEKTVSWSNPQGGSTTTDVVFTVPTPTTTIVVEYMKLFDSVGNEFAEFDFGGSTYTYNNNGEFTVSSVTLSLV